MDADTTRIGVGQWAMMYSVAASPLISGSIMSIVTTSGRSAWHSSTARFPSPASPTSSMLGSAASISHRRRRTVSESSTTTTRIFDTSTHQLIDLRQERVLIELALDHVPLRAHVATALQVFRRRS